MLGPILEGQQVVLAPAQLEDLPVFCRWFADFAVSRTLGRYFVPSQESEEEWFRRTATDRDVVHWCIRVEGRAVGVTSLFAIDWLNRSALSGLLLGDRSVWGRGYASEAVALRTAFAFDWLNLERLESESLAGNTAMHRALQKSGYTEIGRRHQAQFRDGRRQDAVLFELLRDDWREAQG